MSTDPDPTVFLGEILGEEDSPPFPTFPPVDIAIVPPVVPPPVGPLVLYSDSDSESESSSSSDDLIDKSEILGEEYSPPSPTFPPVVIAIVPPVLPPPVGPLVLYSDSDSDSESSSSSDDLIDKSEILGEEYSPPSPTFPPVGIAIVPPVVPPPVGPLVLYSDSDSESESSSSSDNLIDKSEIELDFLDDPLGVIQQTFKKAVESGFDPVVDIDGNWGDGKLIEEFVASEGFSKVPLQSQETINFVQPNTLVRLRGMIQQMLFTEDYVGAYKEGEWITCKFRDVPIYPLGPTPVMRIWERHLLHCVPVPGHNTWTEAPEDVLPCSSSAKNMRQGEFPAKEAIAGGASCSLTFVSDVDKNCCPCLVKIYGTPKDDLKLNDVLEFVGVLACDPEVDKDDSDKLLQRPPSKVVRLHCLAHRKLSVIDFFGLPILEPNSCKVRGIREALLRYLTAALGDDAVAAQFMLLHLLSKVHARVEYSIHPLIDEVSYAVGKLSLNLTRFNKESMFGDRINYMLKSSLPFTRYLTLTMQFLNTASLAPVYDYQSSRLVTGVLQLAEGLHLTIDETPLEAGTLNPKGYENRDSLQNLMVLQQVNYDFKYHKRRIDADFQILVLSDEKSKLLPVDLVVPFWPTCVGSLEPVEEETLKEWRSYLETFKSLPHSDDAELVKVLEEDLILARRADRSSGYVDFSRSLRMTMTRLLALSFGETWISQEHLQIYEELERIRNERLQSQRE